MRDPIGKILVKARTFRSSVNQIISQVCSFNEKSFFCDNNHVILRVLSKKNHTVFLNVVNYFIDLAAVAVSSERCEAR